MNRMTCLNKKKWSRMWRKLTAAALALSLIALTGCGKGASLPAGKKSEKGYSLPEIMVIAMTEKNRYEEICTEQIWNVTISDEQEDFASYLTGQIKNFMEELKIMNLLAEDKKMTLSPEERSQMTAAASEYYGNLTSEDISHMGVTEEDVRTVFEDYCMAEKLVEALTEGIALEVSDSEAKVITLMQAETSDRQAAENLVIAASQENANFEKSAEDAGLSVTTRQLGRKEEAQGFEDAAFGLASGQVSQVIESDGSYYVLKCISDYDEEATAARKKVIFEERKRKAFREIYDRFKEEVNLTYSGDPWNKLDLGSGRYAADADFFEIYRKHSGQ